MPAIEHRGLVGLPVTVFARLSKIEFGGEPLLEVTTERVGRLDVETATLKFKAAKWADADEIKKGSSFVIETPDGDFWLLGRREAPAPLVKFSRTTGSPSGDAAVCSFEVKYTAMKALVLCSVVN